MSKPQSFQGDLHHLPSELGELVALPNWVVWRWEQSKTGKWTKVPYQPNGNKAKNNDLKTWSTYGKIIIALDNGKYDGIGFCLLNGNFAAFDIDHCRNPETGEIDPWAIKLAERAGSYAEVTVSGTGLRIIGQGIGGRIQHKFPVHNGVSVELYRNTERYIVITGKPLEPVRALTNIDVHINDVLAELEPKKRANGAGSPSDGDHAGQQDEDGEDKLEWTIATGDTAVGKRSDGVWYVIMEMLRRGYLPRTIAEVLLNKDNRISDHIYDQADPPKDTEKQVTNATKNITMSADEKGNVYKTQANIRVALLKLGVTLRYDEFADRTLLDGLKDFGPVVDDAALDRIWLLMDQRFRLQLAKELARTVILDVARLNKFHPVRDYLNAQRWDGVKRIDTWLTVYGGVEDNEYTRAVGALFLVAAVRRVRVPGCKFDEMVVFENDEQGTERSTMLATLAVCDEWFSDDLPLNVEGKQVIEALRGRWVVEAGELSGMRRADIAHVKALLSRQVDRARMAYGRIVSEVPRQCVIAGTTNDLEYLRDTTGNRRFWPVRCQRFDVEALKRDRAQLWAEAAAREARGISIRLDQKLWPMAGREQAKRLTKDPWLEALQEAGLGDMSGKISMGSIWVILDVRGGQQTQEQSCRVGKIMRDLGWRRPSVSGLVKIDGEPVSGFVKGEKPWNTVAASRSKDGGLMVA
jgi:predicted P-loop ATPase